MRAGIGYFLVKVETEQKTKSGIIVQKTEKDNPKAFLAEVISGQANGVKEGMTVWCDRRKSALLDEGIHAVEADGIYAYEPLR